MTLRVATKNENSRRAAQLSFSNLRLFSKEKPMQNHLKRISMLIVLVGTLIATPAGLWSQRPTSDGAAHRIEREVRRELVMLPFYGVFDNLAFKVQGDTVTLLGQVTRPTLKSDAEAAIKTIEGIGRVTNEIEVLPLAPADDRIRLAVYRAIYSQDALERYALQAIPPVHIIVKNGRVTLEGVVASEMDKNIANLKAKSVPGVFSVTNNLRLEKS